MVLARASLQQKQMQRRAPPTQAGTADHATQQQQQQQMQRSERDTLVQALGEFALFVARMRRSHKKKRRGNGALASPSSASPSTLTAVAADEKRAVLEWLRSLTPAECASLSAISDVGFVKTLLSMAMASKQRRATRGVLIGSHVDEFQLLPFAGKSLASAGDASSWLKGGSAAATPSDAPREFVRRPRVRTADGDVLGAFHARDYNDSCAALLPFVRILNASRSCDTVALAMALFEPPPPSSPSVDAAQLRGATSAGRNARFLRIMEHIADGQFLSVCPSDAALRSRVWGETPWLAARGYYSLQALLVNEIELNIWRHWLERKKLVTASPLHRVPLRGLSAKLLLAQEWERASAQQQREILTRLGAATTSHLRGFDSGHPSALAVRASLSGLVSVLTALHNRACERERRRTELSVDVCFSSSLTETVAAPQVAVLQLIMAETLQEQCSLLLSERLALEDERASSSQRTGNDSDTKASANHTQRRRANRKKLLKRRRHEAEERAAQQQRLRAALDELRTRVRQRREQTRFDVGEIVDDLVARAATAKPSRTLLSSPSVSQSSNQTVVDLLEAASASSAKRNAKKKKRKKSGARRSDVKTSAVMMRDTVTVPAAVSSLAGARRSEGLSTRSAKPSHQVLRSLSRDEEEHPVDSDEKENVSSQQLVSSSPDARPLLSFLDKSYASPLTIPPFGPQPLYASSPVSPPFFLSLAPRTAASSSGSGGTSGSGVRGHELVTGGDRTSNESAASSSGGGSGGGANGGADKASDATSFEWYLPSLFSSESSSHHTNSTTSSLDWDFHNWQLKNDVAASASGSASGAAASSAAKTKSTGLLSSSAVRATLRGGSHVVATGRSAGVGVGVGALAASSPKTYSLESFSSMLRVGAGRSIASAGGAAGGATGTNAAAASGAKVTSRVIDVDDDEDDDVSAESAVAAVQSDFLYRQGGFFDRQRALKRRRRPLPFDYEEEEHCAESDSGDDHVRDNVRDDIRDDGAEWGEYPRRCCDCGYHDGADSHACACSSITIVAEPHQPRLEHKRAVNCAHESSAMLERLARLESALEEKTQAFDEIASTLPKELASLQQSVTSLSAQLQAVETELRELKLSREAESNSSRSPAPRCAGKERSSSVTSILSENSPLPPPPPPHPPQSSTSSAAMGQSDLHQQQPHPPPPPPPPHEMASSEYMYSSQLVAPMDASASVLGPFVSVPMSVLPPRTKLHWDMCEFVSQLQTDSNARLPTQMAALRLCTATVQSLWPRAQVRPYGSFVSRLVLPTSDIDLVICLPKVRRDAPADAAGVLEGRNAIKETWQQNLARKLRLEPWVVPDSVKTIPLAAIPIITLLTTAPYSVRLDISFEGPGHNGLATNDVVLALLHEFPPLAPIMLVLKSFAIERGFAMAYSGGLSSYSLLLMVARYLQEHSDTVTSGFENVSAAVHHSISAQSCADFGMMLMGFLDFYGNRFDPRTTGISVASRCFLNRENALLLSGTAKDQVQYAADDAVLDDRSSAAHHHHQHQHQQHQHQHHWQMPSQSAVQDSNLLSSPGSRRYGNRSSMDWPQNTHMVDLAHDPHKFDPVFIEDPLHASNNVGRNLFRITQIRRAFSAAYSTLLAASVTASVFADNRATTITGVALHPDNMLRAILGAHAPVKAKSDAANVGVSTAAATGGGGIGASGNGNGGGAHVGFPYPSYTHAGVSGAAHFFTNGSGGGADASHSAAPYPFYSHYQQPQPMHYLQAQQQRAHGAMAGVSVGVGFRAESSAASAMPSSSSSYRRYSESGSEKATSTRSSDLAAAVGDRYYERRRDRLASPRLATHAAQRGTVATSLPFSAATTTAAAAAAAAVGDSSSSAKDEEQIKTRKGPARSLSFADVVVGGNTVSASTMEYHRKEPSSPLARSSRYWRDDSAIEDSMSEKWEARR